MWARQPRIACTATAEGIRRVAEAIKIEGGYEAMQLRVAEQYVQQFGQLAKEAIERTVKEPAAVLATDNRRLFAGC